MKYPNYELEARSLTGDEYLELGELFNQFKQNHSNTITRRIGRYASKFPKNSKVAAHFYNWSQENVTSDPYMSLILTLRRLYKSVYDNKKFEELVRL